MPDLTPYLFRTYYAWLNMLFLRALFKPDSDWADIDASYCLDAVGLIPVGSTCCGNCCHMVRLP